MTIEQPFMRTQWGMLGQWWCIRPDLSEEEQTSFLTALRDDLGTDFAACPLEYIRDRVFGGFRCGNGPERQHVYFAVGYYTFLGAAEGRYYPIGDRGRVWTTLLEHNPAPAVGLFSEDFVKGAYVPPAD